MAKSLPGVILLILTVNGALADEPGVNAFKYEFSVRSYSAWTSHFGVSVEYKVLEFRGESIERIPGDAAGYQVFMKVSGSTGGVTASAREEMEFVGHPEYPPDKPQRSFHFQPKSIQLTSAGEAGVRLKFKDATDDYLLRYVKGEGLRLEEVNARFGKIVTSTVPEFVILKRAAGRYVWQCSPFAISATKDGIPLWSSDIPMEGLPEVMSVLDEVLFIKTTSGHSFYVLRDTGELVFYDGRKMSGNDPSDDILALWQREIDLAPYDLVRRGYFRFIRASVMLNEKRAIPLLIECIERGRDLNEKCAAIAALEKFNGNPGLWSSDYRLPPSYFLKKVGMKRVFPTEARKAERKKWENLFEEYLKKETSIPMVCRHDSSQ